MDNISNENEEATVKGRDVIKSLYELKEEFTEADTNENTEDLSIAVENDEVNNEEMQKSDELENLEYADGKERDEVDFTEEQEKIYGVDTVSPFKTADVRVFKRKLETMSRDKMAVLANRVAARTYSSEADQKEELLRAFHSWSSTNGFIQTSSNQKPEKGALAEAFEGAKSSSTLTEKLKTKTLSDLQSTAARLGFNPGFDRDRIINLIVSEFRRQS
tara:strand:+ start:872 stop:1525 length:654 start_codon:yes stop_codon:yes gene_type:complete